MLDCAPNVLLTLSMPVWSCEAAESQSLCSRLLGNSFTFALRMYLCQFSCAETIRNCKITTTRNHEDFSYLAHASSTEPP